jgi:hypothetical protein
VRKCRRRRVPWVWRAADWEEGDKDGGEGGEEEAKITNTEERGEEILGWWRLL